jgi:hypothetical protein
VSSSARPEPVEGRFDELSAHDRQAHCDHRTNDLEHNLVQIEFVASAATYSVVTALSHAGLVRDHRGGR